MNTRNDAACLRPPASEFDATTRTTDSMRLAARRQRFDVQDPQSAIAEDGVEIEGNTVCVHSPTRPKNERFVGLKSRAPDDTTAPGPVGRGPGDAGGDQPVRADQPPRNGPFSHGGFDGRPYLGTCLDRLSFARQGETLTPRGERNRRSRCPVCGSRKVMPSLGRLGSSSTNNGDGGMPRFSWRCRACRTSMRAHAQRAELWRPRRPLSNWLHRRAPTGV